MQIRLDEIDVDVVKKKIRNIRLTVYPPAGRVRISAPLRMKLDTIRDYLLSKLDWIRKHRQKIQMQEREAPARYLDRESHLVWGERYQLTIIEKDAGPLVELHHDTLVLQCRPAAGVERKQAILEAWYREQLKDAVPPLIAKWEPLMGVKVGKFFVRRMKTRWGSCNPRARSIRFNTDLARKPPQCLEYIVVHEMAHLLEPSHNSRFKALMDRFMPNWRCHKEELNRLPVRHKDCQ
jgi:predicted metal-dependent hydrolase